MGRIFSCISVLLWKRGREGKNPNSWPILHWKGEKKRFEGYRQTKTSRPNAPRVYYRWVCRIPSRNHSRPADQIGRGLEACNVCLRNGITLHRPLISSLRDHFTSEHPPSAVDKKFSDTQKSQRRGKGLCTAPKPKSPKKKGKVSTSMC